MKLLFILFICSQIFAQVDPIIVDGDYIDWNSVDVLHTDPSGDNSTGPIDFRKLKVSNDDNYLFIDIGVGGDISLLETRNVTFYIDTDVNASTGLQYAGMGVELRFKFGDREGEFYYDGNSKNINHADIDLYPQPTVTSNRFEFAISRNATIDGRKLFSGNDIKIMFKDMGDGNDRLPDNDGGVQYTFENKNIKPLPNFSIAKTADKYLRMMTYNVEQDGLFNDQNKNSFNRIFSAVNPEIIAFQEIYSHGSQETADKIEEFLPSVNGQQWYHSKPDYDIVLVSRYEIKSSYGISPKSGHLGDFKEMNAFLLDLRPKYDTDLLVINAHPKCCSGEEEDEERQNMCDAIMEFVREAKKDGGELTLTDRTPIVIMGDMNFVGDNHQPQTILTGNIRNNTDYGEDFKPDWNYSYLSDANPLVTNMPVTSTTYNPDSDYPPGRLDYIFYTGSLLNEVNSYALYTPALTNEQLIENNLDKNDTFETSDHLPLIIDFELLGITDIREETMGINKFKLEQNYPNPFNPTTAISYQLSAFGLVKLTVYDVLGNKVANLVDEQKSAGSYSVNFDASSLTSGVYFYKLESGIFTDTKKMLLLR